MLFLLVLNVFIGSVDIPFGAVVDILSGEPIEKETWTYIILQSRLPQAVTALLTGAALSVAGLMLQTLFSNPLASPGIMGINTGASLGVAVVMLVLGGSIGGLKGAEGMISALASSLGLINAELSTGLVIGGYAAIVLAALIGALLVIGIIILFSYIIKSNVMLLIVGLMLSYIGSSVISLLNYFSSAESVYSYTIWSLGDFAGVSLNSLPAFSILILLGLFIAIMLIKPMNALLLGDNYAKNLGVNVKRLRFFMFISTGILVAVSTAFCGPISFIGLAVPHLARLSLSSSNHNILMFSSMVLGSIVALGCNILSSLPTSGGLIPINAITPIIGAPIIIYVIINQKRIQYFN